MQHGHCVASRLFVDFMWGSAVFRHRWCVGASMQDLWENMSRIKKLVWSFSFSHFNSGMTMCKCNGHFLKTMLSFWIKTWYLKWCHEKTICLVLLSQTLLTISACTVFSCVLFHHNCSCISSTSCIEFPVQYTWQRVLENQTVAAESLHIAEAHNLHEVQQFHSWLP